MLEQCLNTSGGKTSEKNFHSQILAKIRPNVRYFAILSIFGHYFSFKFPRIIAWNNI